VSVKTVLTVALTVLGVVALAFFLFQTKVAIATVLAAALLATAMHHAVDFLQRHKFRRPLAIATVLLAIFAVFAGIVLLIVPPAVQQGEQLMDQAPRIIREVKQTEIYRFLNERLGLGHEAQNHAASLQETAVPALHVVTGFVGIVTAVVTTFLIAIFMLIFGGAMIEAAIQEATIPRRQRYKDVARKIYHSVGGYISGIGLICSINAVLTTTYLAIVHIPFFLPLGILSGFSSTIPYAGPVTAGALITLITLATHGLWAAVGTVVYFILYGLLEGQVLGPLIFKRTVHINPLVTVLASSSSRSSRAWSEPSSRCRSRRPGKLCSASSWPCVGSV